ncbi:hypothetical protein WA538_001669 [Blastocystis sp. DL]
MNTLQLYGWMSKLKCSFVKTAVSVTRCFTPSLSAFSSMFSNPVLTREFSSAGKSKKSVTKRFSFTGTGKVAIALVLFFVAEAVQSRKTPRKHGKVAPAPSRLYASGVP